MFPAARVPSLQRSSSNLTTQQQSYKITPISNLLGRSGSSHLILGLLTIAPTGTLAIGDLSGSIALDLKQSRPVPEDGAWFTPGMIVLVDGMYEEEYNASAGGLGGGGGVGGTIGGKFIGFTIGGPPCERRDTTLGVSNAQSETEANSGAGFGWVDFLGVGSERAMGSKMRRLERQIFRRTTSVDAGEGRGRIAILGEVSLDNPKTLEALKKVLSKYATDSEGNAPMAIVLMGNFVTHAVMAGGGSGGSIEYKEYFDALASVLSEFPTLLQSATFIFVPGDKDPWASAFSAGASTAIPRKGVPDLFTSRVKRAFASANSESEKATGSKTDGEAIWTTNPTRLSLFGPSQEIVIFRDNLLGRLRRNAITFKPAPSSSAAPAHPNANHNTSVDNDVEMGEASVPVEQNSALGGSDSAAGGVTAEIAIARKLVKTILDQGHLSPFPLSIRPVLWDHSNVLQLYPMPTALVLADPEAPAFALTYEGCHAMNAGSLLSSGRRNIARWLEFDSRRGRGKVREVNF
ncbi:MAG: DNA-directed DNA polymerase epsilon, subunit B [Trizodia sp. TS-e1964]|nr:MAG: DNA-directed DNA polymerase epsilon, subunit B [Trizodia sp. TS-e1964]